MLFWVPWERGWKLTGIKDVCIGVGCRTRFGSVVANVHLTPRVLREKVVRVIFNGRKKSE